MTVTSSDSHHQPWAAVPPKAGDEYSASRVTSRPYPWGRFSPLLRGGVRPLFVVGDGAACVATALAVHAGWQSAAGVTIVMTGLLAAGGLNRSRLSLSALDDLPQIIRLWLVGAAFLVVASELVTGSMQLILLVGVLPAIILARTVLYQVVRSRRHRGSVTHPTVVVGSGSLGQLVVDALRRHPETGLRAVGFVDARPLDIEPLPIPLLGEPAELSDVLEETRARALIVASGEMSDADLVALVRNCQRKACEVFVLPRLHEVTHVAADMDAVGDLPLIRLRRSAYRSPSWRLKRWIDVAVSGALIALLAPLLVLLALAVRLETGRGVIFRQERVGRDGVSFELLKFKSMKPADDNESATNWNITNDSRLGPVGRLIRKTSLDELPQLFNILRGDMSLVGPRPERPHFANQFGELYSGYADRHRVPCGLTGWAQIHGLRGDTPIDQRARFDNFYIENWTLWLDVKIILRTVVSVFTKPGS